MKSSNNQLSLWLTLLALSEQATRDWLTGLHNRRYFEESLADHLAVATRYGRELSLVLFDLDRFKQINDAHGHAAGDDALRQFATDLKTTARQADLVCRYGGDEFVVILPETARENAEQFVARVVEKSVVQVTAGVAALPCPDLVSAADSDLLARKRLRFAASDECENN
jgi:diguanylate cyclase (GGDEF)-like protein